MKQNQNFKSLQELINELVKSFDIVTKQKDTRQVVGLEFLNDQSQFILFLSTNIIDRMKKRTGLWRSQVKEQIKKQKRTINNILNSKIIQNSLDVQLQNFNDNLKYDKEQSTINNESNHNNEHVMDVKNNQIDPSKKYPNKSDLQLCWNWPQHEKYTKQLEIHNQIIKVRDNNGDVKSTLEYISVNNYLLTSNNQIQQLNQNQEQQAI